MSDRIATCLVELGEINDADEQWVTLLQSGELRARDGRRWTNADSAAVVRRTQARAGETELVVDYEHQTDYSRENGQPAPAAGWITRLQAAGDGIRALIRWNRQARERLREREYRYLSPTFTYDKSRRVQAIMRAALTNNPAFDLPALATATEEEETMHDTLKKLLGLFGLTAENLEDEAALDAALSKAEGGAGDENGVGDEFLAAVAEAVGLDAAATDKAVLAKCRTLSQKGLPDPEQYVPMEQFKDMASTLKTLQDERAEEKASDMVEHGIREGKITPAMREWALGYAKSNPESFVEYLTAQPVIVAPGQRDPQRPPGNDTALTTDEEDVLRRMGVNKEQYLDSRKDLSGRTAA